MPADAGLSAPNDSQERNLARVQHAFLHRRSVPSPTAVLQDPMSNAPNEREEHRTMEWGGKHVLLALLSTRT